MKGGWESIIANRLVRDRVKSPLLRRCEKIAFVSLCPERTSGFPKL